MWSVWEVYASGDCLEISEIHKFLRSRSDETVKYETARRTADNMVKLSEGMLTFEEKDDRPNRLRQTMSVDEWRKEHYQRKKEEREERRAEAYIEASEKMSEMTSPAD